MKPIRCYDTHDRALTRLEVAGLHDPYRMWGPSAWNHYRRSRSAGLVARLCGVTARTLRRWDRRGRAPDWALRLLILMQGFIVEPGWEGYYFEDGRLHRRGEPVCWEGFMPGHLEWLELTYSRLSTAEREVERLTSELARLRGAPAAYPAAPRLAVVDGRRVG